MENRIVFINPQLIGSGNNRVDLPSKRIPFCYLHGKLEELNGFDIFAVVDSFVPSESGIYNAFVLHFNVPATFFLWADGSHRPHGLVVANDDVEGLEYAKEQYILKSECL